MFDLKSKLQAGQIYFDDVNYYKVPVISDFYNENACETQRNYSDTIALYFDGAPKKLFNSYWELFKPSALAVNQIWALASAKTYNWDNIVKFRIDSFSEYRAQVVIVSTDNRIDGFSSKYHYGQKTSFNLSALLNNKDVRIVSFSKICYHCLCVNSDDYLAPIPNDFECIACRTKNV